MEQKDNFKQEQDEQILDIRSIIYFCISKWYWFAISIVLSVAIASLYTKTIEPSYSASAKLQVKSSTKENPFSNIDFAKNNIKQINKY